MTDEELKQLYRQDTVPPLPAHFSEQVMQAVETQRRTRMDTAEVSDVLVWRLPQRWRECLAALLLALAVASGSHVYRDGASNAQDDLSGVDALSLSSLMAL